MLGSVAHTIASTYQDWRPIVERLFPPAAVGNTKHIVKDARLVSVEPSTGCETRPEVRQAKACGGDIVDVDEDECGSEVKFSEDILEVARNECSNMGRAVSSDPSTHGVNATGGVASRDVLDFAASRCGARGLSN